MKIEEAKDSPIKKPGKRESIETATFSMGCFWRPDALFGATEGVLRTRVGYAGGTSLNPTYRRLEDHIETFQLEYDPAVISFKALLDIFFTNHKPVGNPWKRQYMSAIFHHHEGQKVQALEAKERHSAILKQEIYTPVYPYQDFYLAEERHQKYKLQRHAILMTELKTTFPDFNDLVNSTAVARINGYLYGFGNESQLESTIQQLGLSPSATEYLRQLSLPPRGVDCSG